MDLYILDSMFRRRAVYDKYNSLIWSERWQEIGDFELVIESTPANRRVFVPDVMVSIRKSVRVMIIEAVEDTFSDEGEALLKVTGRSMEKVFEDRVAKFTVSGTTSEPTWNFNDVMPRNIVRTIYNTICYTGKHSTADIIPYTIGGQYSIGDIPFNDTQITLKVEPKLLSDVFPDIAKSYSFGYRLVQRVDVGQNGTPVVRFEIYSGNDYSSIGTNPKKIIFSPDLDNLQNTTELNANDDYKNVAYVITPGNFQLVYGPAGYLQERGFKRRILLVTSTDEELDDPVFGPLKRTQLGQAELAKHNRTYAFDGELKLNSGYTYGVDYELGDRVELKTRSNIVNVMRVSEQIFICDEEGEREYPTLELDTVVQPDTWAAAEPDDEWIDHGATDYWSNA